jgi:protein-S-isoprenylcysteine O-methyltransferase Ste14
MRILPPMLVLMFTVLMIALGWLLPGPVVVPSPYNWLGAILLVAGFSLTLPAARRFHRIGTNIKTFNEPTLLVTDGLFNWSRNPMYLGMAVFLAGLGILLGTLLPLLVAAAFVAIADRWYIRFEESAMHRKFGDAYAAYTARTRRWI